MNIPFQESYQKKKFQNNSIQNKGLLQPTCKADAGLFLELQTFVLCLNSYCRKKMRMKALFVLLWPKIQRSVLDLCQQ